MGDDGQNNSQKARDSGSGSIPSAMDGSAGSVSGDSGSGAQVRQISDDGDGNGTDTGSVGNPAPGPGTGASTRDLLSARPFVRGAKVWRDRGWLGTIPLPAKSKNPPPVGWTGRLAPFPDNKQISEWCSLTQYKRGNIGLHLGWPIEIDEADSKRFRVPVGTYELVGIDVDNYEDNGKVKKGAEQLRRLEDQLGPLPRTYVSTARASRGDLDSGIRFYLVPRGLAFRGQVDHDIEVIQKNHRFAVVWPSYNPKSDSQYCLYAPDEFYGSRDSPGKHSVKQSPPTPVHLRDIPDVKSIPLLPEKWVDFLTNGRMQDADGGIDMDSSVDEIYDWAKAEFNDANDPCVYMKKVVRKWKKLITDEATSHDKVRDAHWEIINCGAEGHTGWAWGLEEIDTHWIEDVMSRSKRSLGEMRGEMFRSKTNCIRKVKVKVENATSAGTAYTPEQCVCAQRASITASGGPGGNAGGLFISDSDADVDSDIPDGLENVSWGHANDPNEYELNDDGNAQFLGDLLRYKAGRLKFAEGYGWILWTDSTPDRPARWMLDEDGLIRRAFWRVKRHQKAFAEQKEQEATNLWQAAGLVTPMPQNVKDAFAAAKLYRNWAIKSGNNNQAEAAINAAKKLPGVTIDINELNRKPYLLGVANGVLELRTDGVEWREAQPEDFVTYNTNVMWHSYNGISVHDHGRKLWQGYLDKFIPADLQPVYQMILGHTIVGGNPERLLIALVGGTSTGKSTMLRAMGAALGDYASTVNLTIFGDHKLNPALANAMPRRVVFTSELSAGDKLSVATVKRMTGNDTVRAELKGVNVEVEGVPQFVPIMATNDVPEISGADEALRRRLLVLPFDQKIEDRQDEKRAAEELETHSREAILAWLVEGYVQYCQNGIPSTYQTVEATKKFADQLDPISEFLAESVIPVGDSIVALSAMFEAFKLWANRTNVDIRDVSMNKFGRRLRGLGLVSKVVRQGDGTTRAWVDVKLSRKPREAGSPQVNLRSVSDVDSQSEKES